MKKSNLGSAILNMILERLHTALGGEPISLKKLQNRYQEELMPYQFCYSISEHGKKKEEVILEFDKGNFCHLFSIGSIVKNSTADLEPFSGMDGWRNIENGTITFRMLRNIDPQQFDYYHPEHLLFSEFVETIKDPQAIRYDKRKVKNSSLEADILLYRVVKQKVIHIALSKDKDGTYFPRSYFVRDVNKDREYPTKYINGMPALKVKTKIRNR
ncbi:PBECR4 domain-containing protein [Ileibacterium valens]|uniref:PBECR4 domain-containing protein n=1 Tax=Ileibacterium valens TaxID=1862668 RepID=UPI00272ABA58|nr:PBECR4 domain-containing protein [Ileibacterium valens]